MKLDNKKVRNGPDLLVQIYLIIVYFVFQNTKKVIYHKIPNMSPGLIDIFKHIFFGERVTFRGDYIQREFVLAPAY